jgi:hypothetical protein
MTVVRPLLASPVVAEKWDEPSALQEFSVRGLAGHLVRAALTVEMYLDTENEAAGEPISPAAYFLNYKGDISSQLNTGVRQRGEEAARGGHGHVVELFDGLIHRLGERLEREPAERIVALPNARMQLDQYLVTRLVELVIHADDLAVSVGLDTPTFSTEAMDVVIGCMLDIARLRQGDLSIIRALSRRERDPGEALRVF